MIENRPEPAGVLLVGNFLSSYYGTKTQSELLSSKLEAMGWKVTVTSAKPNRVRRLVDMLATAWNRRDQYQVAQIAVFSGRAFAWAEAACVMLQFLQKPFVITLHGGKLPSYARRHPWRVKHLLSSASCVTTPSYYLRESLRAFRPDIQVIQNGVDLSQYQPRVRTQPQARLAWLRAFHSIYSPAMAVDTLALLWTEFSDICLIMFGPDKGDGAYKRAMQLAERLGVTKNLSTPGAIPKETVPERLAEFDIFLNTATAESFGVSVVEAGALGMCIVTTNVGELPYIWTHDHDALLVPPNDHEAMAAAVRRILTEPGLAQRLSRNARTTAEQFDWANILPRWEKLLLDVAEQGRR
ncbi:MAG: glycosyltransferase family 4 protein [Anaerolineae bacterium]|nr:glycosyltransferase family 4 protein [Anaerolineae bacterium]